VAASAGGGGAASAASPGDRARRPSASDRIRPTVAWISNISMILVVVLTTAGHFRSVLAEDDAVRAVWMVLPIVRRPSLFRSPIIPRS
jgi:hypothetical protein